MLVLPLCIVYLCALLKQSPHTYAHTLISPHLNSPLTSLALTVSRPRYALARLCITQKGGAAAFCIPPSAACGACIVAWQLVTQFSGAPLPPTSLLASLPASSSPSSRTASSRIALNLNEGWLGARRVAAEQRALQLTDARGRVFASTCSALTQCAGLTQLALALSI